MLRVFAIAAVLALSACAQQGAAGACQAASNDTWVAGETVFNVEASTTGPDCEHAVATLVIRDGESRAIFTEAYPTEYVMTLREARDVSAMRAALDDWIASNNSTMVSTSALPDWPANADGPVNGEFPFYVADDWDRDTYLGLRTRDAPLFCYVQGGESLNCLAFDDGTVRAVGVQTFPG